ncbi:MAG: aldolase [Alphaproteobacteria bacterium]|nr:aldolase [Alphaproteobacteria bacterium]
MTYPSNDSATEARRDLAAALRWAVRLGLHEGICNHFSLALPGRDDRFLLNPWSLHWKEVTASNLIVVDPKGTMVEGQFAAEPTAFYIHARIHLAHPEARCVLHTHMPYATALTMLQGGRLEPALQTAIKFWDDVAYDEVYNGLVLDEAEGDRVARGLGRKRTLFLAQHGVIVIGQTVAEAFDRLYYLERACQAQVLAMSTGRPLRTMPAETAAMTARQMGRDIDSATLHFKALRRILDREEPEYAG